MTNKVPRRALKAQLSQLREQVDGLELALASACEGELEEGARREN